MEQSKNKRTRRTRAELEADVFDAIRQLASEKGLAQITFTDIMQRADIQMSVLLNNYKNIERLLDKYAYISDYWLHDLFDEEHPTDKANEDIMKSTLKALANYLYEYRYAALASVGTRSRQFDHKTYGTKQGKALQSGYRRIQKFV